MFFKKGRRNCVKTVFHHVHFST